MKAILKSGLICLGLVLAGCGNTDDKQGALVKQVFTGAFKKNPQAAGASPGAIQAQVAAALAATDLPLALAVVEKRNTTAMLTRIETNGAYGSWASPDRRVLIMRGGLVTGTRGLGGDIMSSDLSGVAGLIAARKAGSGQRVMRFLDGENHTVALVAECRVSRGVQQKLSAGEIKARLVTEMKEACDASGRRFDNRYLVDGMGRVIQSRQWIGPDVGYITIQALR